MPHCHPDMSVIENCKINDWNIVYIAHYRDQTDEFIPLCFADQTPLRQTHLNDTLP